MNSTNDIFQGLSILLLSEDDGRGKALAKALRDQRARVGETNISTRESARGVDLAVVDARAERSLAGQLAELRADVRGRWASLVTVDFTQLVMADGSVLLSGLVDRVAPLVEADRALSARARSETTFKTTLAPLGPPRTLRALSLSGHTLAVELRAPTLEATIEVSNELLVSAAANRGDKRWEAWSALVRILGLSNCEITVTRRAFTSFMNIMEPVDQALEVAAQERACSVHQIEREEADAEARANGGAKPKAAGIPAPPPVPAAAWTSPAGPISPPKPAPPARPAGSLGPQRTLMGIMPGLPAPGIAANDVRAITKPPPTPEMPRYAHRAGAPGAAPKASMTLMGVAPSSIPGLAEQLRKSAVEPVKVEEARVSQREALKHALEEEFDPPTVRHNSLPDLTEELPELAEDLSSAARPLSSPLPPPPRERDDGEREPPPGMSFDDVEEEDQTMITPSHLAEELLARALEGAATERPPPSPDPSEPPTTRQPLSDLLAREIEDLRPSAAQSLPASEPPVADAGRISSDPAPANDPNEAGASEDTMVVSRKPEKKPRSGLVGAIAALAAVFGLISYAAMRSRPEESTPAPLAVAPLAEPAPVEPEPAAPSEPKPSENALVPLAPSGAEATPEPNTAAEPAPVPSAAEPAVAPSAPTEPPSAAEPAKPAAPAAAAAQPAKATTAAPQPAAATAAVEPTSAAAPEEAPAGSEFDELLKKGQRLLTQRDAAGARPLLEQALALQPDNPHVRASLGETLLKLGELPAALVQAQTAVKLRPKRGHYSVIVGNVLAAMGRADEALAAFQRAYELDPNDAEAKRKAGF